MFNATAATGATLKPETVNEWNGYVRVVTAEMQQHLQPGQPFIRAFTLDDLARRVRSGETVVFPSRQTPQRVSNGLIHDWTGITFIPNATVDDVLSTVRDYEHYKNFYSPAVMEAKTVENTPSKDRFSIVLVNKPIVAKTAFNGEYESSYVQIDGHRWYSVSETTRMREVQNYGTREQRMLDENEGSGLIWRLLTLTRYEQQDGGVYVEVEAVALSRDIPGSLRWIINPIVRRVSRNSLLISLEQTSTAVASRDTVMARNHTLEQQGSGTVLRNEPAKRVNSFR